MSKPAVVQSAPQDPKYLFGPENDYFEPSYLSDKFIPALGGLAGFAMYAGHNYSIRKPLLAGLPFIIGATIAGTAFGVWYQKRTDDYWAERDAIYRHYINLHPEDFPAKERIVVGDMLKSWVPIR